MVDDVVGLVPADNQSVIIYVCVCVCVCVLTVIFLLQKHIQKNEYKNNLRNIVDVACYFGVTDV